MTEPFTTHCLCVRVCVCVFGVVRVVTICMWRRVSFAASVFVTWLSGNAIIGYTHPRLLVPPLHTIPNKRAIMADGGVLKICFVSRYKFHVSEGANSNSIKALNNLMNTSGHSCENWRVFGVDIYLFIFSSDTSSHVSSVTVTVTRADTPRCWDNATTETNETGTTDCLWWKRSCPCCVIKKRDHNTCP